MKKKLLATLLVVAVFAGLSIVYATSHNASKGDSSYSESSKSLSTAKEQKTRPGCCEKNKSGECKVKGEKPCDMKGTAPSED